MPDGWKENTSLSNSSGPMVASYISEHGEFHVDVRETGRGIDENFKVSLLQTGPNGGTTDIESDMVDTYKEVRHKADSYMRIANMKMTFNDAD